MISKRDKAFFWCVMKDGWTNEKQKRAIQAWFKKWKREHDIHSAKLPDEETMTGLYKEPIDTLGLSVWPYNGLRRHGIHTIGALLSLRVDEVRDLHLIGKKGAREIEDALAVRGWRLTPPSIVSDFEKWLEETK